MALIKHAQSASLPRDAIVLDLAELAVQAREIIARATEKAANIAREAEAERRRLVDHATADGFAAGRLAGHEKGLGEGRAQGLDQARAEHAEALSALERSWTDALASFESQRETMLMHARADVLALALCVAQRVTKRVVEVDPKVVEAQVEAVLQTVTRPTRLSLRVHPADLEAAKTETAALASRLTSARHAEVVADESLSRGSVRARSDRGEIDATIETQLDRIVEALLPGGAPRTTVKPDVEPPAPSPARPPAAIGESEAPGSAP